MIEMKNCTVVPQKVKNRITMWSSNSSPNLDPEVVKAQSWADICILTFIVALFAEVKIQKQLQCPLIDELINSGRYVNGWKEVLVTQSATCTNPEGIILRKTIEINQLQKYYLIPFLWGTQ